MENPQNSRLVLKFLSLDKSGYCGYFIIMKTVGVKNLKDQLSQYLKLVKNGETIIVTDRNEIIAEIRKPLYYANSGDTLMEQYLKEQAQNGKIIRAKRSKSLIDSILSRRKLKKIAWMKIYNHIKEERLQ